MPSPLTPKHLGTVLAVWAHPDDESVVAGGLLSAVAEAGNRVVCLTATRGELGTADPGRWPADRLGRTRDRELAAARAVLGIDEQRWLPYADGSCDQVPVGVGMAGVARVISDVQPDTIVTFGPDGVTGHPDHRAVSAWTSHAWAATGGTARLLWASVTAGAAARMAEVEAMAHAFYPGYPVAVPDADVALHLDLRGDTLDRKVSAMRAHASQTGAVAHDLGEDAFAAWWSTESYVEVGGRPSSGDVVVPVRPTASIPSGRPRSGEVYGRRRGACRPAGADRRHLRGAGSSPGRAGHGGVAGRGARRAGPGGAEGQPG